MKKNIILIFIAFCLMALGINLMVYEIMDFNISNTFKDGTFTKKVSTYEFKKIKNEVEIIVENDKNAYIEYDNSLEKDNYKIVVTYFNELFEIGKILTTKDDKEHIYINYNNKSNFSSIKKVIDVTIDGLKKNEVYNYYNAFSPVVKVYINEENKNDFRIRD